MRERYLPYVILFCGMIFLGNGLGNPGMAWSEENPKRMSKQEIVEDLQSLIRYPEKRDLPDVHRYSHLTTTVTVAGKTYTLWRAAIQAALDEHQGVYLPRSEEIYYLDAPLLMDSNTTIQADADARIHAIPTLRTCLVRNRHMLPGRIRPVYLNDDSSRDQNLVISGGIWSQESTVRRESYGASDAQNSIPGSAGVLLFSNVSDLSLTHIRVEKGAPFAIHVSNAKNVFISDISVETNCDGVHLNGPLDRAVIQKLDCVRTGDDCIALNAWDWPQSGPALGPIDRVLVQDCQSIRGSLKDIRLLPGVLKYPDGTTIDCPITNVVIRNIVGFNYFKMYAQSPAGAQHTCQVGTLDNIYFDNIQTVLRGPYRESWTKDFYGAMRPTAIGGIAPFSILSNARNLTFENLTIASDGENEKGHPCIFYVGPESAAFRWNQYDAEGKRLKPLEIFMHDSSCVVENIELRNIRDEKGNLYPEPEKLVKEVQLSLNPNYEKTPPRGGVGSGKVRKVTILPPESSF
ncbi:MAG: hypothetical protein Q4D62_06930 [Planctomycetia bacterium]|nr:hypothetical protein [Planctomycetia bacterium]